MKLGANIRGGLISLETRSKCSTGGIRKCLDPYLFVKDDVSRDKTTLIKEVVIYLPAKILEVS